MGVFQNNLMGAAAAAASAGGGAFYDHQISQSVRIPAPSGTGSSNGRLTRTVGTVDSNVHFTLNFWIKRSALGGTNPIAGVRPLDIFTPRSGTSGSVLNEMFFGASASYGAGDAFVITNTNTGAYVLSTDNLFRDTSAWYNFHIQADLDNGTASEKLKIFINGTEAAYTGDNRSSFSSFPGMVGGAWTIGDYYNYGYPIQSYLAQWCFIDGTTYAASDFGELKNGVWIPKDPSGLTFGSEGFYLDFASSGDLGNDVSGNNNDWTATNIATHDQMLDSPTFNSDSNGGNFATMNPLSNGSNPVLGEGNLMMDSFSGSDISGSLANFALPASSGKWYFECFINAPNSGDNYPFIGLTATQYSQSATMGINQRDLSINLGTGGSEKNETYVGSITTDFTGVSNYADNTICGVFVDMDARKLWYAKDGAFTNSGNPQTGANPNYVWTNNIPLLPHFISFSGYGADSVLNFGQEGTFAGNITAGGNADVTGYGNFKYDPGDFKALCSGNLPVADAIDPAQTNDNYPQKLFSPLTYTGTGSSNALTGLGFQPDLVWIKERGGVNDHKLTDSTRGVTKSLESNTASAEATDSNGLTAFGSDGFTVGSDAVYNNNTDTYVGWNWRANGGTTATNTAGSEDSVVQVDPSGSFSIVTYTGTESNATIGHGLSSAPQCVLVKCRDFDRNWAGLFVNGPGNGTSMILNSTSYDTSSGYWNGDPTSTVFGIGSGTETNKSGKLFVAYCFANTEGYIKSGTYVGNGDDNGTFVYTGFRPAMMIIREYGAADNWLLYDDKRMGFNNDTAGNSNLYPDTNVAEGLEASRAIDILSNGFKLRTSNATGNASGGTYIYLAMAENPFKYSSAR